MGALSACTTHVRPRLGLSLRGSLTQQRCAWPLLCLVLWLAPIGAHAKLCGDNVGGHDVPCACGDVVVSDLTLTDDPVARTVCPHDAFPANDGNNVFVVHDEAYLSADAPPPDRVFEGHDR